MVAPPGNPLQPITDAWNWFTGAVGGAFGAVGNALGYTPEFNSKMLQNSYGFGPDQKPATTPAQVFQNIASHQTLGLIPSYSNPPKPNVQTINVPPINIVIPNPYSQQPQNVVADQGTGSQPAQGLLSGLFGQGSPLADPTTLVVVGAVGVVLLIALLRR